MRKTEPLGFESEWLENGKSLEYWIELFRELISYEQKGTAIHISFARGNIWCSELRTWRFELRMLGLKSRKWITCMNFWCVACSSLLTLLNPSPPPMQSWDGDHVWMHANTHRERHTYTHTHTIQPQNLNFLWKNFISVDGLSDKGPIWVKKFQCWLRTRSHLCHFEKPWNPCHIFQAWWNSFKSLTKMNHSWFLSRPFTSHTWSKHGSPKLVFEVWLIAQASMLDNFSSHWWLELNSLLKWHSLATHRESFFFFLVAFKPFFWFESSRFFSIFSFRPPTDKNRKLKNVFECMRKRFFCFRFFLSAAESKNLQKNTSFQTTKILSGQP